MAPRSRSPSPLLLPISQEDRYYDDSKQAKGSRRLNMMRAGIPLLLIALMLAVSWMGDAQTQLGNSGAGDDMSHFVRVAGGQFVVNCRRFTVRGWNQWELIEAAAGALELFGASLPPNTTGPALVRRLLQRAQANKFNVMRAWAHSVDPQYALQTAPGQYNEAIWRGLDYALDEARKAGVRVLLSLTDNWQQTGGADEFVRWAGSSDHESFFTDPSVKQMYKRHVAAVLGRVNSINGRRYSEDPTIFAWNLINEPRCYQCGGTLALWAAEMAAYVKSLDSNHLVTIGEEGFYPAGLPQAAANPQGAGSWADEEGQDFVADHASPNIDFMTMHLWVNNWEDTSQGFVQRWIGQHIADAQTAGKPLIMEEFGVWNGDPPQQQQYYSQILGAVQQNAAAGGPAQGALFWTWYAEGQRAPAEEGGAPGGLYGIYESNSGAWSAVSGFSQATAALSGGQATGCSSDPYSAPAAPDCSSSWQGGREGTGYEGPSCNTDINECARGTDDCDPNAACINSQGSYSCRCYEGYQGDGRSCQPTAALAAVQALYSTQGGAMLACDEGQDVAYPEGAPGFQYDLTGTPNSSNNGTQQGAYGSRTAVEPISCMLACDAAPGCDSFSYNPAQQRCFLKRGGSRTTCRAAPTVCVSARGKTYSCGVWQTYFKQQGASVASTSQVSAGGVASPAPQSNNSGSGSVDAAARAAQQLAQAFIKP